MEQQESDFRNELLEEATRIGDIVLAQSTRETNGLSWVTIETHEFEPAPVKWIESQSLYQGSSGICLFLAELAVQTGQSRFLEACEDGARRILSTMPTNSSPRNSLLAGNLGVSFFLLRLFEITRKEKYREEALQIAQEFKFNDGERKEMLLGLSGSLLGLLHVHSFTQDPTVLQHIIKCAEVLSVSAMQGTKGIYWDRSPGSTHPLCGFSHGVSGVGVAFAELGYYFQNNAFYQYARQAALYENQFFSDSISNWLDLRNHLFLQNHSAEYENAYRNGDKTFFINQSDMNAWCHGAAGIGLARCRLYELTKNELYLRDIQKAILKTETDHWNSAALTLCHGSAGNAELFLEAYLMFNEESLLKTARTAARRILDRRKKEGSYFSGTKYRDQDVNLFLGLSGIGHFLLRTRSPQTVPSILLPRVKTVCPRRYVEASPWLKLSSGQIHALLVRIQHQRSFTFIQSYFPEKIKHYIESSYSIDDFNDSWRQFIEGILSTEQATVRTDQLKDLFLLEQAAVLFDRSTESDNLDSYKREITKIDGEADVANDGFIYSEYVTNSDLVVVSCGWNWRQLDPNNPEEVTGKPAGDFYFLIGSTSNKPFEKEISALVFQLLNIFKLAASFDVAFSMAKDFLDVSDESASDKIKLLLLEQMKQLVLAGYLVRAKANSL